MAEDLPEGPLQDEDGHVGWAPQFVGGLRSVAGFGYFPPCSQEPTLPRLFLSMAPPSWHCHPPMAEAPSQGFASVPLFSPPPPCPPPYSSSNILSSLFSKYIPNPTAFHPLSSSHAGPNLHCFWLGEYNGFFTNPCFQLPMAAKVIFSTVN